MRKTFKDLTSNIDMVLFNTITNIDYELELEVWKDYFLYSEQYTLEEFNALKKEKEISEDMNFNDESDTAIDVYQYFAIAYGDGEFLSRVTGMPLYYSEKCDLYILWVNFLDHWDNVSYKG